MRYHADALSIGLFNDSYPPIMDGVAMMVRNTARYLVEDGIPTTVVTPEVPGRRPGPVPVVEYASLPFPGRAPYRLGTPWLDRTIRGRIESIPFDIVHAHCPFSSGKLALATARSRGIPIVATMHSRYLEDFRRAVRVEWLARRLLSRIVGFYESVDEVWVPNESTRSVLESYGYHGPIAVQRNGTEMARPDAATRDRLRIAGRKALDIGDDRTVGLYVGQQRFEKNVGLIIGALGRMQRHGTPTPLTVLVGEGPDIEAFRSQANKVGIEHTTRFTGLIEERSRMEEVFAASDFFVFPSTYDTDGIVVTEAAAFALPSIVVKDSGPGSRIDHGRNGLVCDATERSIADAMETLSRDAPFRAQLGRRAAIDLYRSATDATSETYARYQALVGRSHECRPDRAPIASTSIPD